MKRGRKVRLSSHILSLIFVSKESIILVCHLLADFLEAIKKDFEKASKVYKSNCDDYSYGKSCLKYGHYSFLGKGRVSEKGDAKQVRKTLDCKKMC